MTKEWNPYHLNALAKEIRELFPMYDPTLVFDSKTGHTALVDHKMQNMAKRGSLTAFALSMAHRIKDDNPTFDHLKWLDQCSPDVDRFPISELWEDDDGTAV